MKYILLPIILVLIAHIVIGYMNCRKPDLANQEQPQEREVTVEDKFIAKFGDKAPKMLKIAKLESNLNPHAIGYNCYYYKETGKRYSKACRKEDREKAWSWDIGIMQINTRNKSEIPKLKDIDYNLERSLALLKTKQGICHWVTAKCNRSS